MSEQETVTFNLEINVEQCFSNIRQIEGLVFRTLGYMQRLGLPENINQAIRVIQQITMAIRLLHSAMIALELAGGPLTWWRAGLGIVGTGFAVASVGSTFYDSTRGR